MTAVQPEARFICAEALAHLGIQARNAETKNKEFTSSKHRKGEMALSLSSAESGGAV
jgi:hypothetical protein